MFFLKYFLPDQVLATAYGLVDDDNATIDFFCQLGPPLAPPTAFTLPKETAVAAGVALGPSRGDNVLWGDFYVAGAGGCTQLQAPEALSNNGPYGLYSWAAVAANTVDGRTAGARDYLTIVTPTQVLLQDSSARITQSSPFVGRGGPVGACPLLGSEIDAAQFLVGVGPSAQQVQHSVVRADLLGTLGRSSFEAPTDTVANCD
jgi:hypothetical protein